MLRQHQFPGGGVHFNNFGTQVNIRLTFRNQSELLVKLLGVRLGIDFNGGGAVMHFKNCHDVIHELLAKARPTIATVSRYPAERNDPSMFVNSCISDELPLIVGEDVTRVQVSIIRVLVRPILFFNKGLGTKLINIVQLGGG